MAAIRRRATLARVLASARTIGTSIRLPHPRLLAICVAVVLGALWARSMADRVADALGGGFGHVVSVLTPATPEPPPMAAPDSTSEPEEPDEADEPASIHGDAAHKSKHKRAGPPVHAVFIPAQTVLRLANSGARPTAVPVPAKGGRPAGLSLRGVNGLGVGMRDGDVITRVAGQPVQAVGDVISIVLVLRSKLVPRIEGVFWRGGAPWTLVVEQPYVVEPSVTARPAEGAR